jgi:hypothetical protein
MVPGEVDHVRARHNSFILATPAEIGVDSRGSSFAIDEEGERANVSFDSSASFRPLSDSDLAMEEEEAEDAEVKTATVAVPSRFRLQPRFQVCRVKSI